MKITARTRICAVIGDPVGHSLSPQIHNVAFEALELDFVYVAFHVKRGEAGAAAAAVRSLALRGLSVTIPHKVDIIAHLDEIDDVARNIGSVNTVVNEGGVLKGYSTDGTGALRALEAAGVRPAGKNILLLGSGGAARALAFTLATLSPRPRLRILGIDDAERAKLVENLREKTGLEVEQGRTDKETLSRAAAGAEIIIHATPVGMTPRTDESLLDPELIKPEHTVFDVVYTPLETKLLKEARAAGAKTVAGLGMFIHQAAVQFELWTGREAPLSVMEKAVTEALAERP